MKLNRELNEAVEVVAVAVDAVEVAVAAADMVEAEEKGEAAGNASSLWFYTRQSFRR